MLLHNSCILLICEMKLLIEEGGILELSKILDKKTFTVGLQKIFCYKANHLFVI